MANESIHKNPQDMTKEICARLEEQVADISHNMSFLVVALANKLEPFRKIGGSNSKIRSDGQLRDNEDPKRESRK
jgi:hypothetical protein